MARRPRVHVSGGIYHVMLPGNGGKDVFFEPEDRDEVCRFLAEGTERFEYRVHAYCLMTNHLHLDPSWFLHGSAPVAT